MKAILHKSSAFAFDQCVCVCVCALHRSVFKYLLFIVLSLAHTCSLYISLSISLTLLWNCAVASGVFSTFLHLRPHQFRHSLAQPPLVSVFQRSAVAAAVAFDVNIIIVVVVFVVAVAVIGIFAPAQNIIHTPAFHSPHSCYMPFFSISVSIVHSSPVTRSNLWPCTFAVPSLPYSTPPRSTHQCWRWWHSVTNTSEWTSKRENQVQASHTHQHIHTTLLREALGATQQ